MSDRFENDVHWGELLAYAMTNSGFSITWVMEKVGYTRSTYYKHREKAYLSPSILERYGKVLKYDFSKHSPQKYKSAEDESFPSYDELKKERDYWREKYTTLLKENDELKAAYEALKKSSE